MADVTVTLTLKEAKALRFWAMQRSGTTSTASPIEVALGKLLAAIEQEATMSDRILTPEQIDKYAPGVLRYRQHGEQRTYDRHVSLADVLASHEWLRAERDEARERIAELEAKLDASSKAGRILERASDRTIAELEAEVERLRVIAEAAQEHLEAVEDATFASGQDPWDRVNLAAERLRYLLGQKP